MLNSIRASVTINCGDTPNEVTVPGTLIISPNHPSDYDNSQNCRTVIRFTQGQRVLLQFLSFNLESSSTCSYDYLQIRDGDTESANLIGSNLCGDQIPNQIVSSGNTMYMYFHTDGSTVRSGFKLRVDVGKK